MKKIYVNWCLFFIILVLLGCNKEKGKLFWLDRPNNYRNDFIDMVESVNMKDIPIDSMRYYLSWNEIHETGVMESQLYVDTILPARPSYYNYGKIYSDENFIVYILLRNNNLPEFRDYKFFIRTYNKGMGIIDTYKFAEWNKSEGRYCFGGIDEQLQIINQCNDSENVIYKINTKGEILLSSK